jgi:lysophospholipase L1-like esterase
MTRFKQKIFVLIVGLLTALIALEAGLRITGIFYMKNRLRPESSNQETAQDKYTILCLGNSWTLGAGAPPGMSYPDHLRRMLQGTFKGKDIRVINAGVGSLNSAEMLDRLKPQIDSIKPDLIILQAGEPNMWNYNKHSQYLKRANKLKNPFYGAMFSIKDFLYSKSRVYRLVHLLFYEAKGKSDLSSDSVYRNICMNARFKTSQDILKDASYNTETEVYLKFKTGHGYQQSAMLSIQLGDLLYIFLTEQAVPESVSDAEMEEAATWLQKAIDYNHYDWSNYLLLGNIYCVQKKYEKAAECYIEGIRLEPYYRDKNDVSNHCFVQLKILFNAISDPTIRSMITGLVEETIKTNPELAGMFFWLHTNDAQKYLHNTLAWVESDINEMVKIIRSENMDLILQNYPPSSRRAYDKTIKLNKYVTILFHQINNVLRNTATELNVPFIDNEKLFLELYNRGYKEEEYFEKIMGVQGTHFNEKGYEAMARFVYDKIIEEGFINSR